MTWNGAPPSQAPYMYAAGNNVVTTDASGNATFSFGRTFPAAPVVTANGGNGENVLIVSVSATGFTATFRDSSNNGLKTSIAVRCLWQAFPATT